MPTNPVIDHIDYNNTTYDIKDTTSGYITDAGYTVETQAVEIVPEQSVETTVPGGRPFAIGQINLAEGIASLDDVPDTLTITFNGTEYVCEATVESRRKDYGALYDADTDTTDWSQYPFIVSFGPDPFGVVMGTLVTESAGTYTVKAVGEAKTVVVSEEFKQAVDQTAGATNITAVYTVNSGWTYPTKTPKELKADFDAGKSVIITFIYRVMSPIDGPTDWINKGKMLEYNNDNTILFSTFTNLGGGYQKHILYLSYSSNEWTNGSFFDIPMPNVTSQVRLKLQNTTSNLNEWTLPGTYVVKDGKTYTNLPSLPGYEFTAGIVEVFGSENYTGLTQRFIVQSNNSSGANIYAIRHKTGDNWEKWHFDNNMSTHLKWSTGSHDANYAPPGTIWCRNGSSYTTNLPGSGTYGMLVTTGHWELDSSCSHQTYTEYSSSNLAGSPSTTGIYVRDSVSGNWSAWVKIGPASYTDANNISY